MRRRHETQQPSPVYYRQPGQYTSAGMPQPGMVQPGMSVMYTSEAEQIAREYWELSRNRMWIIRVLCVLLAAAIAVGALSVLGIFPKGGSGSKHKVGEFELRNIGELATQAAYYTGEKNLTIERSVIAKDTYTFFYTAEIKAGLDFGQIEMQVDEKTHEIRLKMPEIRILGKSLEEFRQEDGNKAMTQPTSQEINDVREAALADAERIAIDRNILVKARENAEDMIRKLLSGGYDMEVYTIVFQ